ncbi:MAG: cob(I)yrinic acid a,c-diamide adenosyltransferase [Propionicimonas sp.]|uniref:cob(I)yrinic acid a,c-diamide adenosyltransferase n=1 Tax=Propionicimonas sp. TaxID=1955623 RepID=UPI003D0B447A
MPDGVPPVVPEDGLTARERRLRPALVVNTGEGKGKTTAAMGLALRAWHQGWSIGVFQFVKSGRWVSGERAALEALGAEHDRTGAGGPVEWFASGQGRGWVRKPEDAPDPAQAARDAWAEVALRLADERHQLYVLDEFTYPLTRGWVDLAEVVATLRDRPGTQHVVVTGRGAPPELCAIATTVTEMRKVKHPFDSGQKGQAGIEW